MMLSSRERKKANKTYCQQHCDQATTTTQHNNNDDDDDFIDRNNNKRDEESILFDIVGGAMISDDHRHHVHIDHVCGGHNSSSDDSEAKLKFIFRALFDKCVNEYNQAREDNTANYYNNNNNHHNINELLSTSSHRLPGLDNKSHIVACADVIDYFHRDIIHNMSENHKNEGIEHLRQLFLDHFRGQHKGNDPTAQLVGTEQELLKHFKLDFDVFNEILTKWINQLNTNSHEAKLKHNKPAFYHPYYKKRSNQLSGKLVQSKRDSNLSSISSCSNSPSSLSSSSSIPSISDDESSSSKSHAATKSNNGFVEIKIEKKDSSDEEVEEKLIIIDNQATEIKIHTSFNNSTDEEDFYYENSTGSGGGGGSPKSSLFMNNEFASRLDELKSENIKLRQSQLDMKLQLQNAEEMNEQLVADLEAQNSKLAELNKCKKELTTRINLLNDENEYLKRLIDQLKKSSDDLNAENETLTAKLKDSMAKLEWNENEIAVLSAQSSVDKSEIEKLVAEVNRHRTINRDTYSLNTDLEQQIIEANIQLCEKNHEIEKLKDTLREYRSENDSLSEKQQKLQSDLFILNSQLLEHKLAELKSEDESTKPVVASSTSQVVVDAASTTLGGLNENSFFLEQLEQQLETNQLNQRSEIQPDSLNKPRDLPDQETKSESLNNLVKSLLIENSKLKDELEQHKQSASNQQQQQHLAEPIETIELKQKDSSSESKSFSTVEEKITKPTTRENDESDSPKRGKVDDRSLSKSDSNSSSGRRPSYKEALVKNMKEMDYNFDYLYNNDSLSPKRESFSGEILEIRPGGSSSRSMSQEIQEPVSPKRLITPSSKLATCYTIKSSFEPFVQPSLMASAALTNTESHVVRRNSSSRESCGFLLNAKRNVKKQTGSDAVNTISTSSSKRFQHQINILTHSTFDSPCISTEHKSLKEQTQSQHSLKSQSLPSLFGGDKLADNENKRLRTAEISTQTDDSLLSSSSTSSTCSINNEITTIAKLRHQLTRDSGIDSDHATLHSSKKREKLCKLASTDEHADKSSSNSLTRPSSLPLRSKFERHDYVKLDGSSSITTSIDYPNEKLDLNADLMSDLVKMKSSDVNQKRLDYGGKSEVANRRLLFKNSSRKTVGFNGLSTSVDRPEGTSTSNSSNDKQPGSSGMSLDDQLNDSINSNEELDNYTKYKQALESSTEPVVSHTLLAKLSEELINSDSTCLEVHDENKLKQLESDFEQISLSYQSDKSLVRECMDSYKEKFQRLDSSSANLFDEMSSVLNQLVNVVNELPLVVNQTKNHLTVSYQNTTASIESAYKISPKSRKSMQDDLNKLNYTVKLLKKNLFNLISTTCLLSALKQEAQMSNLIKIAINYVHMLKRSTEATTIRSGRLQNGSFDFFLPDDEAVKDQKSNTKLARALTVNVSSNASTDHHHHHQSKKSHGRKLGKRTKSINKTNFETNTSTKSVAFSDKIESLPPSMDPRTPGHTRSLWLASMSFIRSISGGSTQQDEITDILEKSDLTERGNKSVETDESSDTNETESSKVVNQIAGGGDTVSPIASKYHLNRLPSFMRQDSFRNLRVTASLLLFATSVLVFLIALFNDQDIFKVIFDFVFARKKVALRMKN